MAPELFCWSCFLYQPFDELARDIYACQQCSVVRDLTDPDESVGRPGE